MVLAKKLYSFCLSRPIPVLRYIDKPPTVVTCVRNFSTKKPNAQNIIKGKIKSNKYVGGQNEFVTYQLNTSYAAHLKRQQKLWNQLQKDEQSEEEQRKRRNSFKVRDDNCGHGHKTGHANVANESSSNHFHRKRQIDNDHNDSLSESDSEDYGVEKLESPHWNGTRLTRIVKDVYKPSDTTQNRNAHEVDAFHSKMQIKIDASAPKPILGFNELNGLTEPLRWRLENANFVACTPIQAQGIPIALTGVNMLAISQSG